MSIKRHRNGIPLHEVNAFNVGYHKGGELTSDRLALTYAEGQVRMKTRVNICQSVYNVTGYHERAPFTGSLFTICTAKLTTNNNAHREIMTTLAVHTLQPHIFYTAEDRAGSGFLRCVKGASGAAPQP